jgi:hypothetical protein
MENATRVTERAGSVPVHQIATVHTAVITHQCMKERARQNALRVRLLTEVPKDLSPSVTVGRVRSLVRSATGLITAQNVLEDCTCKMVVV